MYLQDENTRLREMLTNPLPPATPNPAGGGAEEEEQVAGGTEDQGAGWGDVGTSGLLTSSQSR